MDSINKSLFAMAEMFNSKMDKFQKDLHKSSTSSPVSPASLASEFDTFKAFIISALDTLQRQVEFLGREIDRQEMRRRRKMLLFHGVSEEKTEDLTSRVVGLVADRLLVSNFSSSSIKSSYRLGQSSNNKPRPIVVKFSDISVRDKVWFAKTKLKGSGITQSEFLTKSRHDVFLEARSRFGINKCWTRDGYIHILAPDGSRHKVECFSELNCITNTTIVRPEVQNKTLDTKADKANVVRTKRVLKK